MAKLTKKIIIAGEECTIEGDTAEELAEDEAAARDFAERHHNNKEEMMQTWQAYMDTYKLGKAINKVFGVTLFKTKTPEESEKGGK